MKKIFSAFLLAAALLTTACGGTVTVDPAAAVIVVSEKSTPHIPKAAADLQKTLQMITGKTLPVVSKKGNAKYAFRFSDDTRGLKIEEGRWTCTPSETVFSGRTGEEGSSNGHLNAVCDFLERQLRVRWMEPGDDGIFYVPAAKLTLTTGSKAWHPGRLISRKIRNECSFWSYRPDRMDKLGIPAKLRYSKKEHNQRGRASTNWLSHHRMGRSVTIPFAHAFTKWYEKYGKTNPEFFALTKGARLPFKPERPDYIKMCVSNQKLREQIVKEWLQKDPRPAVINVCENDCGLSCTCTECRKLDVTLPGEKWETFLTDRYVNFANGVLKIAQKSVPDAKVCMYAYDIYTKPPRRERVSKGVIIGLVVGMLSKNADAYYTEWRARGAEMMFQRPNDQHANCGLPMGFEEQLWKGFQRGYRNNMVGTDYDSTIGFWAATGVADYVLARAHNYPKATFEELFDHYCDGYGAMKEEIKEYYTYWRKNIWDKKIAPRSREISKAGRWGYLSRGVMVMIKEIYSDKDWEVTGKILDRAEAKAVTPVEKKRIAWLKLNHKHFILTWRAIKADQKDKERLGRELLEFRIANKFKLNCNYLTLCTRELQARDISGIKRADKAMAPKQKK